MTEKTFIEDDLKGLEKEIEAAVDRLFVEKGAKPSFTQPSLESARPEISMEKEKEAERELIPTIPPLASQPAKILDDLETHLFSLEWEITQTNLEKTMDQVLHLKEEFKDSPELPSVLQRMAKVLTFMTQNQEKIRPHLLQFLFDSKETLKLLMRKDGGSDLDTYKKLALAGIEARFSCLEEFQDIPAVRHPVKVEMPQETQEVPNPSELYGALLQRMEIFSEKLDQLVDRMDRHLSTHAAISERSISPTPPDRSPSKTKVTLFKIGERLFGVESDRIEKLFKVPQILSKKIVQQKRLRLKELDIHMVDLENIFCIPSEEGDEEKQVLVFKVNGEYKGILMDGVLNRLSGPLEESGEYNEYVQGMMRWTYQDLPIKIPILDLRKF